MVKFQEFAGANPKTSRVSLKNYGCKITFLKKTVGVAAPTAPLTPTDIADCDIADCDIGPKECAMMKTMSNLKLKRCKMQSLVL